MRITDTRVLRGTNVYHSRPVIVTTLELEEKTEVGSHEIPEFVDRLLRLLPGLNDHHCSPGHPGGFVERLERGTYFAHIVEHIALELSVLTGIEVTYGKSIYGGAPGRYKVVTRFKNEAGMKRLIEGAVDLANAVYDSRPFDLASLIEDAKDLVAQTALGPSALALADAAAARGIPWRRIGDGGLLELGYGKKRQRVQTAVTSRTGLIATDLVQDKHLTKRVLHESFIPVPRGEVARSFEKALEIFHSMKPPLAVKPLNGHHGNGVSLNVVDETTLREAFDLASKEDSEIVVEQMVHGLDYRVLVLDGKMIATAERIPAHVIGNGKDSIRVLIDEVNRDPRRGDGHCKSLTKIEFDEALEKVLTALHLTLDSVPEAGRQVILRETANLSTGGTARDVTDIVHPEIKEICERAARIVGLDVCGIDLIHHDITQPPGPETAIIEVNAGPGLRMHVAPTEGKPRDVGGAIVDSLFPKSEDARIPIIGVTGTNGKTTVARMIAHFLSKSTFGTVGFTSSDGIYIGEKKIASGDTTGPLSSRAILNDPSVDAAVLEVARGGLLRSGLGYDWSDVGIVLNVRPDHFGQDGIETIEDLVKIKSIVAERVRDGGTIVLNADDRESSRLMHLPRLKNPTRKVIYYSLRADNPLILAHLERGERAVFVDGDTIVEAVGRDRYQYAQVNELGFTMRGTAWFQVSNCLASVAAALAVGVKRSEIVQGLTTFENGKKNLGRMNIYRVHDGYMILDYGHNPDAIEAMASFVKATGKRSTAIIGLPGDRSDDLLRESAKAVALGFDALIIRDDIDRRGREPGEVPTLICETANAIRPGHSCDVVLDEADAIRLAVERLKKDEVVVLFYDDYEAVTKVLRDYDPAPIDSPDDFFNDHDHDDHHMPQRDQNTGHSTSKGASR